MTQRILVALIKTRFGRWEQWEGVLIQNKTIWISRETSGPTDQKHKDFVRFGTFVISFICSYNLYIFFTVTGREIIKPVRILGSITANHLS